jgi:hypothetical protein
MTTRIIRSEATSHPIIHRHAFTWGIAISIAAVALVGMSGCVAEIGDSAEEGAYVDESDVDSTQHMLYSGQRVQFRAAHSLKCADVKNSAAGAWLLHWDCWGGASQYFRIYQQPDGYWTIASEVSGHCLTVPNSSSRDGESIQQYPCTGGVNQKFLLQYSAGSYFIRPSYNGKCLDVSGYSLINGTAIVQWPCSWALNQRFYIENT